MINLHQEYIKYIELNEMVPEYDSLCSYLMDKFKEIRPIALGLAIKNNKVLVSKGYDKNPALNFSENGKSNGFLCFLLH